jgi:hypothetical protein
MKAIVNGAVISGAGVLLLSAGLALSSATAASSASRAHADNSPLFPSSIKCSKKANQYCLTAVDTKWGAIEGQANNGHGVYGTSSGGTGIYGLSSSSDGVGVEGTGGSSGVAGTATSGQGLYGYSARGYGVYGYSSYGLGAVHGYSFNSGGGGFENDPVNETNAPPTLVVIGRASNPQVLLVSDAIVETPPPGEFEVDSSGNGVFTGSVTADGGFKTAQGARGGPLREAVSPESTRATIEDTGTARLESGEGAVRFDPAFARTIDAARGYQVFLTPNGETRGWLYVTAKYEGGFIVREAEHGRSSVDFDYRVVAHPYGASDARLPRLNITLARKLPKLPQLDRPRP